MTTCIVCGSEDVLITDQTNGKVTVECQTCGTTSFPADTDADALVNWYDGMVEEGCF